MNTLIFTLVIGVGATATMDVWSLARKVLLQQKAPDYGMGTGIAASRTQLHRRPAPQSAEPSGVRHRRYLSALITQHLR